MQVRWMIRRDLGQVLDIELEANWREPWSEESFLTNLRQRNCIGMVAEEGESIEGFMLYFLHKDSLLVSRFEAETDTAAHALFDKLIDKLSQQRRKAFTLHIRETDKAILELLKGRGARGVAVVRELFNEWEDAFVLEYRLGAKVPAAT